MTEEVQEWVGSRNENIDRYLERSGNMCRSQSELDDGGDEENPKQV